MIYTSYFGKMSKFPKNFEPISVARWKPQWYKGKVCLALAPSDKLLRWWRASDKNEDAWEHYIRWYYREVVNVYDPRAIERMLKDIAGDKIPVLVCFEKSEDYCHRHLIAAWFNRNGIKCEEWKECIMN